MFDAVGGGEVQRRLGQLMAELLALPARIDSDGAQQCTVRVKLKRRGPDDLLVFPGDDHRLQVIVDAVERQSGAARATARISGRSRSVADSIMAAIPAHVAHSMRRLRGCRARTAARTPVETACGPGSWLAPAATRPPRPRQRLESRDSATRHLVVHPHAVAAGGNEPALAQIREMARTVGCGSPRLS